MFRKVCGMRLPDNVRAVADLRPDALGFIFHPPSPRFIGTTDEVRASGLLDALPPHPIRRIGVFVNAPIAEMVAYTTAFGLTDLQLHGQEPPDLLRQLRDALPPGLRLIKTFSCRTTDDLALLAPYHSVADLFLFDTPSPSFGGTGRTFDWSLLNAYTGPTPFLLSGGIGSESIPALRLFQHDYCIGLDLNSRFETAPGVKSVEELRTFFQALRNLNFSSQA